MSPVRKFSPENTGKEILSGKEWKENEKMTGLPCLSNIINRY
jgi:hypothetical protein